MAGWAVASLSGATTAAAIIQGAAFAHTIWTGHQSSTKQQEQEYIRWTVERKLLLADLDDTLRPDKDFYSQNIIQIVVCSIVAMAASPLYSLWPKVLAVIVYLLSWLPPSLAPVAITGASLCLPALLIG